MKTSTKRAIRAFALAPMMPPLLFFLVDPDHVGHSAETLLVVMTVGALYAYPAALVVGVPAYWIINEHSRLRLTNILAVAAAVGASVFFPAASDPGFKYLLAGAALGLSAGVAFWLLWRPPAAELAAPAGPDPPLRSGAGR